MQYKRIKRSLFHEAITASNNCIQSKSSEALFQQNNLHHPATAPNQNQAQLIKFQQYANTPSNKVSQSKSSEALFQKNNPTTNNRIQPIGQSKSTAA